MVVVARLIAMCYIPYLLLIVQLVSLQVTYGQNEIDTTLCGKSFTCFRKPSGCSSISNCQLLITYVYDPTTKRLNVAIGGKEKWIGFGLNSDKVMDGTSGHVCYDNGGVTLKEFQNNAKTPTFRTTSFITDVNISSTPALLCRFSRPETAPGGSKMKSLNTNWYLISAYGTNFGSGNPSFHDGTFTSSSSVNMTKILSIKGASVAVDKKVVAHGCLMIVAWLCFAATGIFFARYQKPTFGDSTFLGQKIWFQLHRLCMTTAITLSIVAAVIIFVKVGGWSGDNAKAHPYTGIMTIILAIIQPIMAAFRPHPGTDRRWIFNWAHRLVGISTVMLAVVSIFLGLKLVNVSNVVMIACVCVYIALVIIMEVALIIYDYKPKDSYGINSPERDDAFQMEQNGQPTPGEESAGFRKIMLGIALVVFFAFGLTLVYFVVDGTGSNTSQT